jgi:ADP-ribose pyrophosphatase YjhB (NUDIX family)
MAVIRRKSVVKKKIKKPVVKKTVQLVHALVREVSVKAWVEDPFGRVLMVRHVKGDKFWTLPGGRVKKREALLTALKREVREETGFDVALANPVDIFDREKKNSLIILYRVILKSGKPKAFRRFEVARVQFWDKVPLNSAESAKFFWKRADKSFEPLFMIKG